MKKLIIIALLLIASTANAKTFAVNYWQHGWGKSTYLTIKAKEGAKYVVKFFDTNNQVVAYSEGYIRCMAIIQPTGISGNKRGYAVIEVITEDPVYLFGCIYGQGGMVAVPIVPVEGGMPGNVVEKPCTGFC